MKSGTVRAIWAMTVIAWLVCGPGSAATDVQQDAALGAARQAYEASDYAKAAQLLQAAAAKDPQNGEIELLLAQTYYEMQQHDAAIASAEKAVALQPRNSVYHEWLGKAYGQKAEHASLFGALSLARKTRREFETAVALDKRNISAQQALIEFDCSAPAITGGDEGRAKVEIADLAAMDETEGHYAKGNCRRQKKDFVTADAEFAKSLDGGPRRAELVYDIGDYAMKRQQPERLLAVAEAGRKVAPADPRGDFYRGVGLILKKEKLEEAEQLLRTYLRRAPRRTAYPQPIVAHEWLGRLLEEQGKMEAAKQEYELVLRIDRRNRNAREALKRLGKG